MNAQHEAKRKAAEAALRHVVPGELLGVGTGSTVNHLIDLIAEQRIPIAAAVSSSSASTARLRQHGIRVIDLNEVGELPVYIDGADEANAALQLIKGGGGALTREKIIAGASKRFVCIVDESKQVATLGRFPLPVEVLAMAQAYLSREFRALGGRPLPRNGFITDDGNPIIDIHDLSIDDPLALEARISLIPGVVTVGLFAHRPADLLIVGSTSGAREIRAAD